jgi:hypothetical protein
LPYSVVSLGPAGLFLLGRLAASAVAAGRRYRRTAAGLAAPAAAARRGGAAGAPAHARLQRAHRRPEHLPGLPHPRQVTVLEIRQIQPRNKKKWLSLPLWFANPGSGILYVLVLRPQLM